MNVDVMTEVVAIPKGLCPGFDDHFALSSNALRSMLIQDNEKETKHKLDLSRCRSAAALANARAEEAEKAARSNEFWHKWGPIIGGVVGFTFGAVIPSTILIVTK